MFLVPTYLGQSPIHGTGVFAATFIPAGTVIWNFNASVDWEIDEKLFKRFPEPFRTRLLHYCYQDQPGQYILCGDNAKFMNHCVEPNCDDSGRITTTLRDIQPGEELTCDYRSFDLMSQNGDTYDATGALVNRAPTRRRNGTTAHR